MHIVRNFVHFGTNPLATILFKSFIASQLTHEITVLYTHIIARNKIGLREFFKNTNELGLDFGSMDTQVEKRTT